MPGKNNTEYFLLNFVFDRKSDVFLSANHLINQTNLIMRTVKAICWANDVTWTSARPSSVDVSAVDVSLTSNVALCVILGENDGEGMYFVGLLWRHFTLLRHTCKLMFYDIAKHVMTSVNKRRCYVSCYCWHKSANVEILKTFLNFNEPNADLSS